MKKKIFKSKSGYGNFHFYCRYVTFFSFDEKSRVHMHYAAMRQSIKIPYFVWSLHTDILHKLTRKKRGGGQFKEHFGIPIVTVALIFISLVEYK